MFIRPYLFGLKQKYIQIRIAFMCDHKGIYAYQQNQHHSLDFKQKFSLYQ